MHTHSPSQLAETQNPLVGEVTDVNLQNNYKFKYFTPVNPIPTIV